MSPEELTEIRERMIPYIETVLEGESVNMLFLMLTDIMNESSELIYAGTGADAIVENAFGVTTAGTHALLPGIVSRKKQLIPAIMEYLQQ